MEISNKFSVSLYAWEPVFMVVMLASHSFRN